MKGAEGTGRGGDGEVGAGAGISLQRLNGLQRKWNHVLLEQR